ncbi:MAG: hypothetical protein M0R03_23280 [Novosphingobium sp.]|nr:hypothetical protein [Novosphingobium sp.]
MSKEKLGQDPVFSSIEEIDGSYSKYWQTTPGMSKRLWMATKIVPTLISGYRNPETFIEHSVKLAYKMVDELLKQENE